MTDLHIIETPTDLLTEEDAKATIEKAKAKGWEMRTSRGWWFYLSSPHLRDVLQVSIKRRVRCPVCHHLTSDEAEALAWEELLSWINPDKLRRLVG